MDTEQDVIDCPACGHCFTPDAEALQRCPACGEQFFVQIESEETEADREAREAVERRLEAKNEQLDMRKIRVVQLERRSLYRSRTWMLVIAFAFLGIGGQLIWRALAVPNDTGRLVAYFVLAGILALFSFRFIKRARRYKQEADNMHQPDPTTAPDFSTLGNGSQFASNLEKMSGKE